MDCKEAAYRARFDPGLWKDIFIILKEIKELVPEQRFGQIIRNATIMGTTIYHIEDTALLYCLEKYKTLMERTKNGTNEAVSDRSNGGHGDGGNNS